MEGNLKKVFASRLDEYRQLGRVDILDVMSDVKPDLDTRPTYERLFNMNLRRHLTVLLNAEGFYSIGRNEYVSLETATREDLKKIKRRIDKQIKAYQRRSKRVGEMIKGQVYMDFSDEGEILLKQAQ